MLFGFAHLNVGQFFYATILGFFIGYVALVTNSIFPAIILHFMNNGLSLYFSFAPKMNWPFANMIDSIIYFGNISPIMSILWTSTLIFAILSIYFYLTKYLARDRIKNDVRKAIKSLKLETLPLEQAQEKIDKANQILKYCNSNRFRYRLSHKTKFKFTDKIFLYSSIFLGTIITISTFIWGIM